MVNKQWAEANGGTYQRPLNGTLASDFGQSPIPTKKFNRDLGDMGSFNDREVQFSGIRP